jgi:Flp pilus assembly protein TadG
MRVISQNDPQAPPAPTAIFKAMRREDGQSTVEMALSLVLTFALAFLLFECCLLAYTYSVLNDAAREGVRYAVVHGIDSSSCSGPSSGCGDSTASNVIAVVKSYAALSFHNTSAMNVTVSYPDATQSQPSSLVIVSVSYTFVPFFSLFSSSSTLNLSSQGRILY